ncbi:MAG: hypothetical protein GX285_05965 [Clostridiales bacterium]|nr:hypothetical protein [Clostridiales bacterium]
MYYFFFRGFIAARQEECLKGLLTITAGITIFRLLVTGGSGTLASSLWID